MTRTEVIKQALQGADNALPGNGEPIPKHLKMAANPFRFFRGSANLFYRDIASNCLTLPQDLNEKVPLTMVQGDCHLSNFGFLTEEGSHGDKIIFSPNDFDDACIGVAGWDMVRFSVSLLLAQEYCEGILKGRHQSDEIDSLEGLNCASSTDARNSIGAFLISYQNQCANMVKSHKNRYPVIDSFDKQHPLFKHHKKAKRRAAGGKQFFTKSALAKAIDLSGETPKFKLIQNKFEPISSADFNDIKTTFSPYVDDTILDIVRRLGAGTGSVNMDRFYLLVGPADYQGEQDLSLCHIVEVKQQRFAAPLEHFGHLSPINRLNPAHLTVACQRKMQRSPDMVLDEVEWREAHWLVRSRHHARVGVAPEDMCLAQESPGDNLIQYAQTCGSALALAHGRSDRRSVRFEEQICDLLPKLVEEIINSSVTYARQVSQDTAILRELLNQ